MCCALAAVTGIIGTFLFTKLQKLLGLNVTGIISFAAEVSCLTFCLVSVWTPGSPFYLYDPSAQNCSVAASVQPFMNSTLVDRYQPLGNLTAESRYRRDLGYSLSLHAGYQFGPGDTNLHPFGYGMESVVYRDMGALRRVIRDVSQNDSDIDDVPYTFAGNGTDSAKDDPCNPSNIPKTSVILFLIGIITSRIGKYL